MLLDRFGSSCEEEQMMEAIRYIERAARVGMVMSTSAEEDS
jgi:hypothetical protein